MERYVLDLLFPVYWFVVNMVLKVVANTWWRMGVLRFSPVFNRAVDTARMRG